MDGVLVDFEPKGEVAKRYDAYGLQAGVYERTWAMQGRLSPETGVFMLSNLLMANSDALILLARILLMALFIVTGWRKLTNFSATVGYMSSTGAPVPTVSTVVSIIMEFFVGIALILGVFTRPLALIFILFTLATALIGHHYWTMEGIAREENKINFYKNMCIMGGLLLLAVTGPGKFALMQ